MRVFGLVFLLAGCAGAEGDGFDPYQGLQEDPECEGFEGTPVPGATSYFIGDLTLDGDSVIGYEDWVLFANDAWEDPSIARPGWDCAIRWEVFGTASEPVECVGCTRELAVTFRWDEEASDCQPELQAIEGPDNEGTATYYAYVREDGSATFEFSSGTFLGDGVLSETRASYVSESRCAFF